jgi:two-component system, chemotaxis family, protein-glutamate methylesterase/glutaminase
VLKQAIKPGNIIVIGSSAGGPRALKWIFTGLPRLDAGVIVVQHMPKFINESLRDSLSSVTSMSVSIAEDNAALESGRVYIAPSEVHLTVSENRMLRLLRGDKVNYVCPSADVTMKSLAWDLGVRFVGVVITGMGRDGADGIAHIKRIGGSTIAQDEKTSSIFGMPREAIRTGCVDFILPPDDIRRKLVDLVGVKP